MTYRAQPARGQASGAGVRLAVASDLHIHHPENLARLPGLAHAIAELDCDVVILAGDISHRLDEIDHCLAVLHVGRERLFVPGNHDLWPIDEGSATSRERHESLLPALCAKQGWRYLPHDGPVEFRFATFFGVSGWPDGSIVGPTLADAGTCEWEPREPDSALAAEDAGRLRGQLERYRSGGDRACFRVLVTHFVASAEVADRVTRNGRDPGRSAVVGARDGQRLIERTWLPAVEAGLVDGPPHMMVHGHKHVRYVGGGSLCWASGYPGQFAGDDLAFAAVDVTRL